IPIYTDESKEEVMKYCEEVVESLEKLVDGIELDSRDFQSPGFKFNEWEKKGVPVRIEIGKRDIDQGKIILVRRDTGEKEGVDKGEIGSRVLAVLEDIQNSLLNNSSEILKQGTHAVQSYDEFKALLKDKKGFIKALWCGSLQCEESIKYESKATTRYHFGEKEGKCIYCGKQAHEEWVFAIPY
ncbi:MAG: His/Gly/Thr/Pro-type tRNA ligase C-terminal domain-containing protein, partial [Candidatus Dojkabacteria bacterium]|nr:His/Gly/Thr/Pro-type tRNA ligase C-terminal domain-containing protein [Candidatus Dojkabacteria bacterium]